jgi:hypothetical protein
MSLCVHVSRMPRCTVFTDDNKCRWWQEKGSIDSQHDHGGAAREQHENSTRVAPVSLQAGAHVFLLTSSRVHMSPAQGSRAIYYWLVSRSWMTCCRRVRRHTSLGSSLIILDVVGYEVCMDTLASSQFQAS